MKSKKLSQATERGEEEEIQEVYFEEIKQKTEQAQIEKVSQQIEEKQIKSNFQQIGSYSHSNQIESSYYNTYLQTIMPYECPSNEEMIHKLSNNGIFLSYSYTPSLKKNILVKENDYIKFAVKLGYFQTHIHFLKAHIDSFMFQRSVFGSGTFAAIYTITISEKKYIIKSQKMNKQDRITLNNKIDSILEEFIFYKIASVLEYGPKLQNIFGYDIVCFNDSIQFAMELCKGQDDVEDRSSIQKELLENLKKMHSLKIVHRDMKEQNVGWSPSFKRWIFLDFGFAKFLRENIGYKSYGRFIGTYKYTLKQLQELFHLERPGKIDFYYNDMSGLNMVIGILKASSPQKNQVEESIEHKNSDYQELFDFLGLNSKEKKEENSENCVDQTQYFLYCSYLKIQFSLVTNKKYAVVELIKNAEQQGQLYELLLIQRAETLKDVDYLNVFNSKKNEQQAQIMEFLKLCREKPRQKISKSTKKYINNLKKYIYSKKDREVKQWQKMIFYFDNDSKLLKHVTQHWKNKYFMKDLLQFFEESIFTFSKTLLDRLKNLCNIITNLFIPENKSKSWFSKFIGILHEIEDFFMEDKTKNFFQIDKLQDLFKIFKDKKSEQRIRRKILRHTQYEKSIYIIMNNCVMFFWNYLFMDGQTLNLQNVDTLQLDYLFSQRRQEIDEKDFDIKQPFIDLIKTLVNILKNKTLTKEQNSKIEKIIFEIKKSKLNNVQQVVEKLIFLVNNFKQKFHCLQKVEEESSFSLKQTSFLAKKNVQKFMNWFNNDQIFIPISQLRQIFKKYPFIQEIPTIQNIRYNLLIRNDEKAKELQEDLLEMWKQNIENYNQIIFKLLVFRINSVQLVERYLVYFQTYSMNVLDRYYLQCYSYFFKSNLLYCRLCENKNSKKIIKLFSEVVKQVLKNFHTIQNINENESLHLKYLTILLHYSQDNYGSVIDEFKSAFSELDKNKQSIQSQRIKGVLIETFSFFTLQTDEESDLRKELQKILITQWSKLQERFKNIYYEKQKNLLLGIITALKDDYHYVYKIILNFTQYLTKNNVQNYPINYTFTTFLNRIGQQNCYKLTQRIIKDVRFSQMKQNNFFSSFIFMIYLTGQKLLQRKQKIKLLTLSMVNINSLPSKLKLDLRHLIVSKYEIVRETRTVRKEFILIRKKAYASSKIYSLETKVTKKMKKWKRNKRVRELVYKKIGKIQYNYNLSNFDLP